MALEEALPPVGPAAPPDVAAPPASMIELAPERASTARTTRGSRREPDPRVRPFPMARRRVGAMTRSPMLEGHPKITSIRSKRYADWWLPGTTILSQTGLAVRPFPGAASECGSPPADFGLAER